jgi:hypothetical protein
MEKLPNPADGWDCLRYVAREARDGNVGTPNDRSVLNYLVINTWRSTPPDHRQSVGEVSMSMARVSMIEETTGLSRRAVQRALTHLENTGWIYRERMVFDSGQQAANLISVKLDLSAHKNREGLRHTDADGCATQTQTGASV